MNMAKKSSNKTLLGLILVAAFTFYQCLNLYKDIKATGWLSGMDKFIGKPIQPVRFVMSGVVM